MLDDRKLEVLRAIVTEYVASREPVGSKTLVERHNFNVSSATVRNDMAVLEELGYITQPHTSAGRIPTDQGYRLFVDRLGAVKPLSAAERRAIQTFMDGAVDVQDLVSRTVRLLAQLTRQVAMVQLPIAQRATIRHLDFVRLSSERVMVIVVNSSGRVEQRVIDATPFTDAELDLLLPKLREAVVGKGAQDAAVAAAAWLDEVEPHIQPAAVPLTSIVLELLNAGPTGQVMVAGVPNLASSFDLSLGPVLEALEEQMVLMRLLGETSGEDITVRIGEENTAEGFQTTSIVAASYGTGEDLVASLGVVGPTRMDYPSTIASVRAVARYVSRFLTEG